MNWPRLGLFSQFLILFSTTTLLLSLCFAAAYVVKSEQEALVEIDKRYQEVLALFQAIETHHESTFYLSKYSEDIKGDILVEENGMKWSNSPAFPSLSTLLKRAEPLNDLHYAKLGFKYYLLYPTEQGWIAITSTPFNLMVYSKWTVSWPWLLALIILSLSYFILRKWLKPLINVFSVMKSASQGDFNQRIDHHPNNELADLTTGTNKMIDEIKAMLDAKNELLLAISHELRTPLTRVKLSLALAKEPTLSADIAEDINQMESLIEQLLEGERLKAGHKALHLTKMYLPMLINETLEETLDTKAVEIENDIPEVGLQIDVGRFKLLIRNLVNNAITHSQTGTPCKLSIREKENRLLIDISDNGKGIPPCALPHIFEPFYRVNNESSAGNTGIGLGLHLCKSIVDAHEGKISVTSKVDEGTTFTIDLPLKLITKFKKQH